ncbi:AAA family ATPase, partial [Vogesella fluminis]|uniref:AAA family ATPase n=1 Tax=Vogesella fluminis TaxID=1069161 RepID=UPI001E314B04
QSARVQRLLPLDEPDALADRIYAFLSNHLSVARDVSALQGQLRETARHLSDGLATWVPRMHIPSRILRVQATAGSGKTQLALSLLQEAQRKGLSAKYVCFNRPLADHMQRLLGNDQQASTFHALCISAYLAKGYSPNGYQPATYEQAASVYLECLSTSQPDLDLLVIDEAQDFDPAWVTGLRQRLKQGGSLYVLEDADQLLYPRPTLALRKRPARPPSQTA